MRMSGLSRRLLPLVLLNFDVTSRTHSTQPGIPLYICPRAAQVGDPLSSMYPVSLACVPSRAPMFAAHSFEDDGRFPED